MVTPTRDEIRAKALELYMQEAYRTGLEDIPTPEDYELKEENYWLRAQRELMTSPETECKAEETEYMAEHFLSYYIICGLEGKTVSKEVGEPIASRGEFSLKKSLFFYGVLILRISAIYVVTIRT